MTTGILKKIQAIANLQCEKAATADSNAASNREPSASKQYMSCINHMPYELISTSMPMV